MTDTTAVPSKAIASLSPDMPLVVWMVVVTLAMGLTGGLAAPDLIEIFNSGFGRALGEFALILLPSFALAAAMSRHRAAPAKGLATATSPLAGAGMICPDTAYAALSPIAGRQKLDVAFGSYAGFKLLYPAGPLIVATGLGVTDPWLPLCGLALLLPVWLAGALWVRSLDALPDITASPAATASRTQALRPLAPFAVLACLLLIGAASDLSALPILDFLTRPKGALLIAATVALLDIPRSERRACLDSSLRRTGSLLLVIGAATAFGAMLTHLVSFADLFPPEAGLLGLLSLFTLTMLFKLAKGSSMATFAAVAPVAAPIVVGAGLSPVAAVLAICLGSFIAILPNDSFYWLVRRDALERVDNEGKAIWILTGGAVAQALTGLGLVVAAAAVGLI
ncbi:hypothetical protein [Algihabitans sp.]|uniref:GntT/GntP/DsdX family permease n=1 Tax=Algihabitans sp. TaxID=2821514 RepID=UPI003BAC1763